MSRLGFGCGGLSGIYNAPLSHEEGISMIKEAFSKGITLFDTSDLYGQDHDNEIMVGKVYMHAFLLEVQLSYPCNKNRIAFLWVFDVSFEKIC